MRFWDSSAIVPLLCEEPASAGCRQLLRRDRRQVVWCLTRTEALSALCRQLPEDALAPADFDLAVRRTEQLAERWVSIDAVDVVQDAAERLLRVHTLRAADALQLGAALVAVAHRPKRRAFVTLDERLAVAAAREGFDVVIPAA